MNSTSSVCGSDLRIDNFIQFQARGSPCLYQPAHFALFCVWFIFFTYYVVEMSAQFISPLPGRSLTRTRVIIQASFLVYAILGVGVCLIVIIDPYASVLNPSVGLAMGMFISTGSSCLILNLSQLGFEFTQTTTNVLLLSIGSILKGRKFDGFLYTASAIFGFAFPFLVFILNLLLFVILPNGFLTEPYQQQMTWNGAFIVMGAGFTIICQVDSAHWWRLNLIALEQIRFSKSLVGAQSDSLAQVAKNMRHLAVFTSILGLVAGLTMIVIPAAVGTPYWFFHIILGPMCILTIQVMLLLDGSAIYRIVRGNGISPSVKDSSASSSASPGEQGNKQVSGSSKSEDEDLTDSKVTLNRDDPEQQTNIYDN